MNETSSALVLFSGGQDSTTCLAWALSRYERVETIGFSYGQKHVVEMEVREPARAPPFRPRAFVRRRSQSSPLARSGKAPRPGRWWNPGRQKIGQGRKTSRSSHHNSRFFDRLAPPTLPT